jgi:murein endopeptidase
LGFDIFYAPLSAAGWNDGCDKTLEKWHQIEKESSIKMRPFLGKVIGFAIGRQCGF